MNPTVEKFRADVKNALFRKMEDHQSKVSSYERGVVDGLQLAFAVLMNTPAEESEGAE